jgi:hypothetical protein
MKVSVALLPVALSGAIASVAVAPAAAHAAGHRAAPGRGARCVTVDRLTQTSAQAAAAPRYWNPSRTRAAAGATQADLQWRRVPGSRQILLQSGRYTIQLHRHCHRNQHDRDRGALLQRR